MPDLRHATAAVLRAACRSGEFTGPTPGLAPGYVHANLVIVPRDLAFGFLLFCQRNPKPCPLLDVTEPGAPGTPVHFGNPAAIGIRDLARPDFGEPVEIRPGEVPVFWACGVTPQAVVMTAKPEFVITHKPGHMFLTDLKDTDLEGE